MKTGRNEKCPCGSGKKYKNCCLEKFDKENKLDKGKLITEEVSHDVVVDLAKKYGCVRTSVDKRTDVLGVEWVYCETCKKACGSIHDYFDKKLTSCPGCGTDNISLKMTFLSSIPKNLKFDFLYICSNCGNIEAYCGGGNPHCGMCETDFDEIDKISVRIPA